MMQPMFHRRVLTEFNRLIDDCTERFIHKWEAQAARGRAGERDGGHERAHLDIVLRSIFKPDFDRLSQQAGRQSVRGRPRRNRRAIWSFAYKFRSARQGDLHAS